MMHKKINGKMAHFSYPGCSTIDFKPLIIPKKPPIRKDLTHEVHNPTMVATERANPAEKRGRKATGLKEQSHDSGAAKLTASLAYAIALKRQEARIAHSSTKGQSLGHLATHIRIRTIQLAASPKACIFIAGHGPHRLSQIRSPRLPATFPALRRSS
jgi:hypothetical protein